MKLTTSLDGLGAFDEALSRIADPAEIQDELRAAAETVRETTRANLQDGRPPDSRSGDLANSLTVEPDGDGMSWTVSTPLDYGWQLEFGSLSHPATPWLEPALDEARPGIVSRMSQRLSGVG